MLENQVVLDGQYRACFEYRIVINLIIMVLKYSNTQGGGEMSGITSSIRTEPFSHHKENRRPLTSSLGQIGIQFSERAKLRAAVSLASMMVASAASAQEGGGSGLSLPTIDVTGDQGTGYQAVSYTHLTLPTIYSV